MSAFLQKNRKLILLALLGCIALVLVFGVAYLLGVPPRELIGKVISLVQFVFDKVAEAGPVVYFAAMALLPIFGVPMFTFVIMAGPLFSRILGLPMVVCLSMGMVLINMLISYVLGRWLIKPLLVRLIKWLGYEILNMEVSEAVDLLVILRVTPGVPFFIQNYTAGIIGISFFRYIAISSLIILPMECALVLFGDALLHGQGRLILIIVGIIAALVAGMHMLRHHYAKKKAA